MEKADLNKIVSAILTAGFCAGKSDQNFDSILRTYETFATKVKQHEDSVLAKQKRGGL
jgi:hypothetical protein